MAQPPSAALHTFLLDRWPFEAEAIRSLCERVDLCHHHREAAADPADDALRAHVGSLEEQLAEVGNQVRQQRESVPSAAARQLEAAQTQSLATLLQSSATDVVDGTLTTGACRADPANELGRCHELQQWLSSRAGALQSELEQAAQLQDQLKALKAQDCASTIDVAIGGQAAQENVSGNKLRLAVQRQRLRQGPA